jgi:hypothetical protein
LGCRLRAFEAAGFGWPRTLWPLDVRRQRPCSKQLGGSGFYYFINEENNPCKEQLAV